MSKQDWQKNTVVSLFSKKKLWPFKKIDSVLDVACGLSLKSKYIPAPIRVGVDIYEEYFDHIESEVPYIPIKYDVRNLDEIFLPKSFDIVIALDIVEHLEKKEALAMISYLEKIARKAVVIETPEGFIPQDIDILGYGGHEYQTHRCGWGVKEFERMGYNVFTRKYEMTNKKRHSKLKVPTSIKLINAIKFL